MKKKTAAKKTIAKKKDSIIPQAKLLRLFQIIAVLKSGHWTIKQLADRLIPAIVPFTGTSTCWKKLISWSRRILTTVISSSRQMMTHHRHSSPWKRPN